MGSYSYSSPPALQARGVLTACSIILLALVPAKAQICTNQPPGSNLTARINCGGPAVEFPAGCAWTADNSASPYPNRTGGIAINAPGVCIPATNPGGPLACSDRWGGTLNYTFPGLAGRDYQVTVHMAETYWSEPSRRRVNVWINGVRELSSIDPFAAGGGRFLPTLYTFVRPAAANGNLYVGFTASTDQPSVAAIEVYDVTGTVVRSSPSPAPAVASPSPAVASPSPAVASPSPAVASPSPAVASPSPAPTVPPASGGVCSNQPNGSSPVARINCGGPAVQFPAGCAWTADNSASPYPNRTGGIAINAPGVCIPATNPGGPLACSDRWGGTLNYTFPGLPGRDYQVTVHMAETYWSEPSRRRVNVWINGVRELSSIDPFAAGGGRFLPTLYTFVRPAAANGNLYVGFTASLDQPSVAAIEVYDVTGTVLPVQASPSPAPPAVASPSPQPPVVASPSPAPAAIMSPSPAAAMASPSPQPAASSPAPPPPAGARNVSYTTYQFSNARTGVNPYEYRITTANVGTLQYAGQFVVDGYVYAQPLLVHSSDLAAAGVPLNIPAGTCSGGVSSSGYQGDARISLLIIATTKNWIYFFDADAANPAASAPIYCYQLGSEDGSVPLVGGGPGIPADTRACPDVGPFVGVLSTPVVDLSTLNVYVVSKSKKIDPVSNTTTYGHRLYKVSLTNPTPATSYSSVSGTAVSPDTYTCSSSTTPGVCTPCTNDTITSRCLQACGSQDNTFRARAVRVGGANSCAFKCEADFVSRDQYQRPGLALFNNQVYMAFASLCDFGDYRGWVIAYDATSLAYTAAYSPAVPGCRAGIWHAGAGVAVDEETGDVYVGSGSGVGQERNRLGYASSTIKLSSSLELQDFFTPYDSPEMNRMDNDVSSGGATIVKIEGQKRIITMSKAGYMFVLDANNLGGYAGPVYDGATQIAGSLTGPDNIVQQAWCAATDPFRAPFCCPRDPQAACVRGLSKIAWFKNRAYNHWTGTRMHWWEANGTTGSLDSSTVYGSDQGFVSGPGFQIGTPSVSANGESDGVVWTTNSGARLFAHHPDTGVGLYNFPIPNNGSAETGGWVKFTVPTGVNGQVYVGLRNRVGVWRLP